MEENKAYNLAKAKNNAFREYLLFCEKFNEVPGLDLISLIDKCKSIEGLDGINEIFKKRSA